MSDEAAFRTPEQVAQRTELSRKAIYRAIERGELTAYRLCGRLRITPSDEQAWIENNRVTPHQPPVFPAAPPARPAPAEHGLRRLLADSEKSTGLVGGRSYDATPDSDKKGPGDALDVPGPAPGGTLDA